MLKSGVSTVSTRWSVVLLKYEVQAVVGWRPCNVPILAYSAEVAKSAECLRAVKRGHVSISLAKRAKYCDKLRASRTHTQRSCLSL